MSHQVHSNIYESRMQNDWDDHKILRRRLRDEKSYGECPNGCMELVFAPGKIEGECLLCSATIEATTTEYDRV